MSKASSILVCPTIRLQDLPAQEIDVVRRFLFTYIRGMDAQNDKRWRRMWAAVWNGDPGEGLHIYRSEERSGPFHRRHRKILERLFQSQERFRHLDKLHDWMKVGGGWVTWEEGSRGQLLAKPRTTEFESTSEDEMREAHAAMVDFLHLPRSQRYLWPHLKLADRGAMLDSVLERQEGEGR